MTNCVQPNQIIVTEKGTTREIPYPATKNGQEDTRKKPDIIGPYIHNIIPADAYDNGGQKLVTNHEDRTKAYVRRMRPLTVIGGAAVAFALVTQGRIPFWSLAFVAVVLGTSLTFLIIGEIIYQLVSPDGTNLYVAWLHHRRLINEQRYLFSTLRDDQREANLQKTILAGLLIAAGTCILLLVLLAALEMMWR